MKNTLTTIALLFVLLVGGGCSLFGKKDQEKKPETVNTQASPTPTPTPETQKETKAVIEQAAVATADNAEVVSAKARKQVQKLQASKSPDAPNQIKAIEDAIKSMAERLAKHDERISALESSVDSLKKSVGALGQSGVEEVGGDDGEYNPTNGGRPWPIPEDTATRPRTVTEKCKCEPTNIGVGYRCGNVIFPAGRKQCETANP